MAKRKGKRKNIVEEVNLYEDSDETFAFIAGYTEGGVPFGTTWEELGLEPFATQEEIDKAYDRLDGIPNESKHTGEIGNAFDDEAWNVFS